MPIIILRLSLLLHRCRSQMRWHDPSTRGQAGVSTLILLIVGLLVVTTTVGVFMQTTGLLQSQSAEVNTDVSKQLTRRVSLIAASGTVETTNGTPAVTTVQYILKADSDALPVDLGDAVVYLQTPNETTPLQYSGSPTPERGSAFGVKSLRDSQSTAPTLTETTDRFALILAPPPLHPNTRIQVKIVLAAGTTQQFSATVPSSLTNETSVGLQ